MTDEPVVEQPSLEALVETGLVDLDSLHPGGLETTRQLAKVCGIQQGDAVLDVACGNGETACFLAEAFGARTYGVDHADEMIRRALAKARARGANVEFKKAEAASLPFEDSRFDAAICECTLCFLDKAKVIGEMVRVVRPGGYIGMHDLCWREGTPAKLKHTLAEIEGEKPETLKGWLRLFESAGIGQITAIDKSEEIPRWMQESRKKVGLAGELLLVLKILRRWGMRGVWRIYRSERVFSSDYLGYVLIAGVKQ